MKILTDAHISRRIIAFLESRGCDILQATHLPPKTPDSALIERAAREGRIVLTADKDFGELVYRQRAFSAGVILLRLDMPSEDERCKAIEELWEHIAPSAPGHFVVVSRRSIRRRALPKM